MAERSEKRSVDVLSLDDLRFDPDNPRLPASVDGHDEVEVLAWMLVDEGLIELIGSIGEQGYFPGEPVLVAPPKPGAATPPYIVVEGNRRLAAVKLLSRPDLAPVRRQTVDKLSGEAKWRPDELPAILFGSRDEILDYLGYRHVTGVKEWDPLAKARYLEQLVKRAADRGEALTSPQLARRIGSRSDYVDRLLEGLEIYDHVAEKDFYGLEGVNEDSISFSVLTTALSYERLASFVGAGQDPETGERRKKLDDGNLKDTIDWMFRRRDDGTTVLGESRHLGELAAVVEFPDARNALREGTALSDAALLTDEPLQSFRRAVRQATDKLRLAQTMTHRVTQPTEGDHKNIDDLASIARDLARLIRSKIDESDSAD